MVHGRRQAIEDSWWPGQLLQSPGPLCLAFTRETAVASVDCRCLQSVRTDLEVSEGCLVAHLAR